MTTPASPLNGACPQPAARPGRRWAACVAAAAGVSLLSGCALLPGALSGDRAAAPAASTTPESSSQPSSTWSSSPSSEPSQTKGAPSSSSAHAASDADAQERAQAVLAAVYADTWGTHFNMTLDPLPEGIDPQTALQAASDLQTWVIATVAADSVLQASNPQAAMQAYQRLLPANVEASIGDHLDSDGTNPAASFFLLTTLGPGVQLLADPAIHMDYAPGRVSSGANTGDLRLTVSVLAIYPVTYQGADYAIPVHRLLRMDVAADGTIDSLHERPVQYLAACSTLDDGALTPDVTLPDDVALEGVDRMVYNSPIMAGSLLADPREEPSLMPVRRLQCDDVTS